MRTLSSIRIGSCALALGMLWPAAGCQDPPLKGVEFPTTGGGHDRPIGLAVNRDVDILFVIDDSSSMDAAQSKLAAGARALIDVLERPDVAANYRIGFTSTDDDHPLCSGTTPAAGALEARSCRSRLEELGGGEACAASCPEAWSEIELQPSTIGRYGDDELLPRPWIESRSDGSTNLPPGLSPAQAFACMSPQGLAGCGFEAPLESMWKALRRSQTDPDPSFGFVRDGAILSIVHVTDAADCSLNPAWETVFLPEGSRVFWSDPEAEVATAAVCWNAGVVCEGDGTGTYDDCYAVDLDLEGNEVPRDDAAELAVLRPMSRYVDYVREIESYKQTMVPDQEVLVSLLAGFDGDGSVRYQDAADPALQQAFGIGSGCEGASGGAVPPVRLRELAETFAVGDERNTFSICEADYSPALAAIAEAIAAQIKPACMPACVADTDPDTPDVLDPSCTLEQQTPLPDGSFAEIDIPECEADRALPDGANVCFVTLTGDARGELCTAYGYNLELELVRREGFPAPDGAWVGAVCSLSSDKATDCPDLL